MDYSVQIQSEEFDVARIYEELRDQSAGQAGAIVTFVGLVRDRNAIAGDGAEVDALVLEHYPGMTEKSIKGIIKEALDRWDIESTCVVHRVGLLLPRDPIVWVGSAAAHRSEAFDCCEFVMDYLKTKAPFWKKEETEEGVKWIDSLDSDEVRVGRWEAS